MNNELSKAIEDLRQRMNNLSEIYGLNHVEVIKVSQKLDVLIIQHQIKINSKKFIP